MAAQQKTDDNQLLFVVAVEIEPSPLKSPGSSSQARATDSKDGANQKKFVALSSTQKLVYTVCPWTTICERQIKVLSGFHVAKQNPDPKTFMQIHDMIYIAFTAPTSATPVPTAIQDFVSLTDKTINAVPEGFVLDKHPLNPNVLGEKNYVAVKNWQSGAKIRMMLEKWKFGALFDVYDVETPTMWRNAEIVDHPFVDSKGHVHARVHFTEWPSTWDRTMDVFVLGHTHFAPIHTKVWEYQGSEISSDYDQEKSKLTHALLNDLNTLYVGLQQTTNNNAALTAAMQYFQTERTLLTWHSWYRARPLNDLSQHEVRKIYAVFIRGLQVLHIVIRDCLPHQFYHQYFALFMGLCTLEHWNDTGNTSVPFCDMFAHTLAHNATVVIQDINDEKNGIVMEFPAETTLQTTKKSWRTVRIEYALRSGLLLTLMNKAVSPIATFQHWLKTIQTIFRCFGQVHDRPCMQMIQTEGYTLWIQQTLVQLLQALRNPEICTEQDIRILFIHDSKKNNYDMRYSVMESAVREYYTRFAPGYMEDFQHFSNHFWSIVWCRTYANIDKLRSRQYALDRWITLLQKVCAKKSQKNQNNNNNKDVKLPVGDGKEEKDTEREQEYVSHVISQDLLWIMLSDSELHEHVISKYLVDVLRIYAKLNTLNARHWDLLLKLASGKSSSPIIPAIQKSIKDFMAIGCKTSPEHFRHIFLQLRDNLITKLDQLVRNQMWLEMMVDLGVSLKEEMTLFDFAVAGLNRHRNNANDDEYVRSMKFYRDVLDKTALLAEKPVIVLQKILALQHVPSLKIIFELRPMLWSQKCHDCKFRESVHALNDTLFVSFLQRDWVPRLQKQPEDARVCQVFELLSTVPLKDPDFSVEPLLEAAKSSFIFPARRLCIQALLTQLPVLSIQQVHTMIQTLFASIRALETVDDWEHFKTLLLFYNAKLNIVQTPEARWQLIADQQFQGVPLLWKIIKKTKVEPILSLACEFIADLHTRTYYEATVMTRLDKISGFLQMLMIRYENQQTENEKKGNNEEEDEKEHVNANHWKIRYRLLVILLAYIHKTKTEALALNKAFPNTDIAIFRDMPQAKLAHHPSWFPVLCSNLQNVGNHDIQRISYEILTCIPPNKQLANSIQLHQPVEFLRSTLFYGSTPTSLSYLSLYIKTRLQSEVGEASLTKNLHALYTMSMYHAEMTNNGDDIQPFVEHCTTQFLRAEEEQKKTNAKAKVQVNRSAELIENFILQFVMIPPEAWLTEQKDIDSILLLQVMHCMSSILELLSQSDPFRLLVVAHLLKLCTVLGDAFPVAVDQKNKPLFTNDFSTESVMFMCFDLAIKCLRFCTHRDTDQVRHFFQQLVLAIERGLQCRHPTLRTRVVSVLRTSTWPELGRAFVSHWQRRMPQLTPSVCEIFVLLNKSSLLTNEFHDALYATVTRVWTAYMNNHLNLRNSQTSRIEGALCHLIKPIWSTSRYDTKYFDMLLPWFSSDKMETMDEQLRHFIFVGITGLMENIAKEKKLIDFWDSQCAVFSKSVHQGKTFTTQTGLEPSYPSHGGNNGVYSENNNNSSNLRGLQNPSNVCYIIATIQQLFMTPTFRQSVFGVVNPEQKDGKDGKETKDGKEAKEAKDGREHKESNNIIYELQRLFVHLSSPVPYPVEDGTLIQFLSTCYGTDGKEINIRVQDDASQFYASLLLQFDQHVKGTPYMSLVRSTYGQIIENRKVGKGTCAHVVCKDEDMSLYGTHMLVKDHASLEQALQTFVHEGGDKELFCDTCGAKRTSTKYTFFKQLPSTMVFSLKRFDSDAQGAQSKLNTKFTFPFKLDMKPFCSESHSIIDEKTQCFDKDNKESKEKPLYQTIRNYYQYRLVGIVMHRGQLQGGHYYSYVLNRFNNEWYECNDSRVTSITIKSVIENAYGGNGHDNAFMLFYERLPAQIPVPMTIQLPQEIVRKETEIQTYMARDRFVFEARFTQLFDVAIDHCLKNASQFLGTTGPSAYHFSLTRAATTYFFMILLHSKRMTDTICQQWMQRLQRLFRMTSGLSRTLFQWFMEQLCDEQRRWWDKVRTIKPQLEDDISEILSFGLALFGIHGNGNDNKSMERVVPTALQKLILYCTEQPDAVLSSKTSMGMRRFLRNCLKNEPNSIKEWFLTTKGQQKWNEFLIFNAKPFHSMVVGHGGSGHSNGGGNGTNPLPKYQPPAFAPAGINPINTNRPFGPVMKGGGNTDFEALLSSPTVNTTTTDSEQMDYDSTWSLVYEFATFKLDMEKEKEDEKKTISSFDDTWHKAYFHVLFVRYLFEDRHRIFDSRLNEIAVKSVIMRYCTTPERMKLFFECFRECFVCYLNKKWTMDDVLKFLRKQVTPTEWLAELVFARCPAINEGKSNVYEFAHTPSSPTVSTNAIECWNNWFDDSFMPTTSLSLARLCAWIAPLHNKVGNTIDYMIMVFRLMFQSALDLLKRQYNLLQKDGLIRNLDRDIGFAFQCVAGVQQFWTHLGHFLTDEGFLVEYAVGLREIADKMIENTLIQLNLIDKEHSSSPSSSFNPNRSDAKTTASFKKVKQGDADEYGRMQRMMAMAPTSPGHGMNVHKINEDHFGFGWKAHIQQEKKQEFWEHWTRWVVKEGKTCSNISIDRSQLSGNVNGYALNQATSFLYAVPKFDLFREYVVKTTATTPTPTMATKSNQYLEVSLDMPTGGYDTLRFSGARVEFRVLHETGDIHTLLTMDLEDPVALAQIKKCMKRVTKNDSSKNEHDLRFEHFEQQVKGLQKEQQLA